MHEKYNIEQEVNGGVCMREKSWSPVSELIWICLGIQNNAPNSNSNQLYEWECVLDVVVVVVVDIVGSGLGE